MEGEIEIPLETQDDAPDQAMDLLVQDTSDHSLGQEGGVRAAAEVHSETFDVRVVEEMDEHEPIGEDRQEEVNRVFMVGRISVLSPTLGRVWRARNARRTSPPTKARGATWALCPSNRVSLKPEGRLSEPAKRLTSK
eukprot:5046124-Amphidinium_carterae.3